MISKSDILLISDIGASDQFLIVKQRMEEDFPFLRVSHQHIDGAATLETSEIGQKFFCLYRGKGEVFLPQGYRTQEGDGVPLPPDLYTPDELDQNIAELLSTISSKTSSLTTKAQPPVDAILRRLTKGRFCGDIAGELWRLLEQAKGEYTTEPKNPSVEKAIASLFLCYRKLGFSTKTQDSWETIKSGDMLAVTGNEKLKVRGEFSCFSLEKIGAIFPNASHARRLQYLLDTAGGCSPGFDPFRRLPITWYPNYPGEMSDGVNFFNNHIVNIPAENSPTHFHPRTPIGGGMPQTEFYLVLDQADYNLAGSPDGPKITLFPDLKDLSNYKTKKLSPGMFIYMPPGTGHRGEDVFAMIMTVPGFKPGNELYLDRDICDKTSGASPYNPNHLNSKNYDSLEKYITRSF